MRLGVPRGRGLLISFLVVLLLVAGAAVGWLLGMFDGRPRGIEGDYAVTGELGKCTGFVRGCNPKVKYSGRWSVIHCTGERLCKINKSEWIDPVELVLTDGRWAAKGHLRPEYAVKCFGELTATTEDLDIEARTVDGVTSLSGTVLMEVTHPRCKPSAREWTVTGTGLPAS